MSKNTNPVYLRDPVIGMATASVANTARDGTGTLVDVVTGAADDSSISMVMIKAQVSTTAGAVRLFLYDGTNTKLLHEFDVPAVTASGSAHAHEDTWTPAVAIGLRANWKIKASVNNAEAINVFAFGGNY